MRKILLAVFTAMTLILSSCGGDDDAKEVVVELGDAMSLSTSVLKANKILLDWNLLKTIEQEVVYKVNINGTDVASNIKETKLIFDGNPFLIDGKTDVVLDIVITAFDSNQLDKDLASYAKSEAVILNGKPSSFDISSISLSGNSLFILFSRPIDMDSDKLFLDFYIDDTLVEGNVVFSSLDSVNYLSPVSPSVSSARIEPELVRYSLDVYDIDFSKEVTLRIVAKDDLDNSSEAAISINLTASDIDLGNISATNSYDLDLDNEVIEVDNTVGVFFKVEEATAIRIKYGTGDNYSGYSILRKENDQYVYTSYSNSGRGVLLEAGDYRLDLPVYNSTSYSNFTLETFRSTSPDVDLGVISLPYQETKNIHLEYTLDSKIVYSFEVTEEALYRFEILNNTSNSFQFTLYDADDSSDYRSSINNGYGSFLAFNSDSYNSKPLAIGSYDLEITAPYNFSEDVDLNIIFEKEVDLVTKDLGELSLPFSGEYNLTTSVNSVLGKEQLPSFEFEITESASYYFAADESVRFEILNEFGSSVAYDTSKFFKSGSYDQLQKGKYTLVLKKSSSYNSTLPTTLSFNLSDQNEIRTLNIIDLGIVTTPYFSAQTFDFSTAYGQTIEYFIEVKEAVSYKIGTGLSTTYISLFNLDSNSYYYFPSSSNGIIDTDENAMPAGKYRIELRNNNIYSGTPPSGTLEITLE